jgi:hypothetical protein
MATLQQFITAAVVASGCNSREIGPALAALDAYVALFEVDARRNALISAAQSLNSVQLHGAVRDALDREIEIRIADAPPMS